MKIKKGAIVRLKHATIRDPAGQMQELEEHPDYGIVLGETYNHYKQRVLFEVQWFDHLGGPRDGPRWITDDELEEYKLKKS